MQLKLFYSRNLYKNGIIFAIMSEKISYFYKARELYNQHQDRFRKHPGSTVVIDVIQEMIGLGDSRKEAVADLFERVTSIEPKHLQFYRVGPDGRYELNFSAGCCTCRS